MTKPSPAFRKLISQTSNNLVLTPLLLAQLKKGEYESFEMKIPARKQKKFDASHVDGWFHPSTHPLLGARQLYYYITERENWDPEPFSAEGRMSVTIGTMMHAFMERLLLDCGALVAPQEGLCPACSKDIGKKKGQCYEHGVADNELMSRGHMDGIVNPALMNAGFEFKSSNPRSLEMISDNDIEAFKKKYPVYNAQVQEYMRMSKLPNFIVLFMTTSYPWSTKEFHIEYDPEVALATEQKYRLVRDHVKMGVPPEPCCAIQSKEARNCAASSCEIRQITRSIDRV